MLPDEKLRAGETGVSLVLPLYVLQLDSSTDDRQTDRPDRHSSQDQGVLMRVLSREPLRVSQIKGMSTTSFIP